MTQLQQHHMLTGHIQYRVCFKTVNRLAIAQLHLLKQTNIYAYKIYAVFFYSIFNWNIYEVLLVILIYVFTTAGSLLWELPLQIFLIQSGSLILNSTRLFPTICFPVGSLGIVWNHILLQNLGIHSRQTICYNFKMIRGIVSIFISY